MEDRDTKGDLYAYMLGMIASAGQHGQFRTPRYIIQLMVELTASQSSDLSELERMLAESGVAGKEQIQRAAEESHGLGLFVRALIGMDREAAKQAFAQFMQGKRLSANQIEFVNLIINHLTQHGVVDAGMLYESPFTDLATQGAEDQMGQGSRQRASAGQERVSVVLGMGREEARLRWRW